MAFPPPTGSPIPRMGPPPMFRGAPPFLMPHGQPGLLGPGIGVPMHMSPMASGVRLPLQPPLGIPPMTMGMPGQPPPIQHTISAPPMGLEPPKPFQPKVPVISAADMKVATTVFVGNISDKATDTLVRQILLRCGRIEGWKRVQDASGKLQGFGFCEFGEPDSTLRALRLLHDFKLGEKTLVVKVDAKTRKDLLKYVTRKKRTAKDQPLDDEAIEKEVAEIEERDGGIAVLRQDVDDDMKDEDTRIITAIKSLAKENIEILSTSRSSKDEQLERDVKDALLSMAKQSGKIDPDSTLDDMDMEDDMKTLVSDEIKKFRQSYQRDEEKKQARRDKMSRDRERDRSRDHGRERERDKDKEKDRGKDRDRDRDRQSSRDSPRREKERERGRGKSPLRERSRSPRRRSRSPRRSRSRSPRHTRSRSPRRSPQHSPVRSRSSPVRSLSQERAEREKRRERERRQQKDALAKEEEEYEERQRAKKLRERERVYRDKYEVWMSRERRKGKEYEKDYEKEGEKRDEMEREKRHLAEFLEDYDDEKDDQRYYKGSAYARRRRERELEIEEDERDRHREKEEIEALRLQVMERQHQERRAAEHSRGEEEDKESEMEESSSPEDSPQRRGEEEEEEDMPVKEIEEDIPLTKPGYPVPPAYPPIQVQSAPVVMAPEIKDHPREKSIGDGITIRTFEPLRPEEAAGREEEEADGEDTPSSGSPQTAPKLAFGLTKKSSSSGGNPSLPPPKKAKLEHVFSTEEDEAEWKPKKKLVPIEYSEEEQQAVGRTNKTAVIPSKSQRASAKQPHEERKITNEERKKMVQNLVNSIPTTKDEVFAYELKWEQIDKTLMEKRVGPWINKKIVEYVGEEEPSLKDFICNKLACNIAPGALLGDIAVVLDDEAEVFVVKLWRLLIYETEAKHLGIAKNY